MSLVNECTISFSLSFCIFDDVSDNFTGKANFQEKQKTQNSKQQKQNRPNKIMIEIVGLRKNKQMLFDVTKTLSLTNMSLILGEEFSSLHER